MSDTKPVERIWLKETHEDNGWKFGYWANQPQDSAFTEYVPVDAEVVDEVQRRMDAVVDAAVEWCESGEEGVSYSDCVDKGEVLSNAVYHLKQLRSSPDAEDKNSGDAVGKGKTVSPPLAQWQPIETAPQTGLKILVAYQNPLGKWRRVHARYYPPETLESELAWDGWSEPGWYEACEAMETIYPVEHEPVYWMPLPPAPGEPYPSEYQRDVAERVAELEAQILAERRTSHNYTTRLLVEHEEERKKWVEQFELLDDPHGLYSKTKERIESAGYQRGLLEAAAINDRGTKSIRRMAADPAIAAKGRVEGSAR